MSAQFKTPPLGFLIAVSLVGPFATHLIVPALPKLQREFDTDYGTVQLVVTLFMIAFGTAQILVGALADAYGRRRVMIGGLVMFCIASVLCALATSIEMLIAMRIFQGLFASVGIVLGRAIVRDVTDGDQTARMLGYMAMGVSVGPMLAPAVGGLLYENLGWEADFWFLATIAATAAAFAWFFVAETHRGPASGFRFSVLMADFGTLLSNRRFILCGAAICFNTAMFYCFVTGAPFVAVELLDMTPTSYGLWFSVVALGYGLGNLMASRVTGLLRPKTIIMLGSVFVSALIVVEAALFWTGVQSPAAMFIIMGGITFSSGLIMPQALAGTMKADPSKAGSASGLIGFTQFAFAAAFSYVGGMAIEGNASALPLFAIMFAISIAGTLAAALMED